MTKNGQNPQNYVKKLTSNTEYELKFDKNHSQLPFSMVFVDLDTYLTDIWKFFLDVPDPKVRYFYTDFVLGSSEQVFYYRLYAAIWMHIEMIPD